MAMSLVMRRIGALGLCTNCCPEVRTMLVLSVLSLFSLRSFFLFTFFYLLSDHFHPFCSLVVSFFFQ